MSLDIVLIEDHVLLRNGLAQMLESKGYRIIFQASNGKEFIDNLLPNHLPQIALVDINMPVMDGFETVAWIKQHHPQIKTIALSMYDTELNIVKMLKHGAMGYVLKYAEPEELIEAIECVASGNFYFSGLISKELIKENIDSKKVNLSTCVLNDKEQEVLKLCCSDYTYKEIADLMHLSPKTIENYRESLFAKLNVTSRVGLVMQALKMGLLSFNNTNK